ncbi:alpha-parvin-like [Sycon ciliatum]|uniref:alpha-parvin-like n=1 Tax=Sycon ciliatum TaxID=27933 RepID=UPI0031F70377
MGEAGPERKRLFSSSLSTDLTASPRSRSFSGLTTLSRRLREEREEVKALAREAAKALSDEPSKKREDDQDYLVNKQTVFIHPDSLASEGFKNLTEALLDWVHGVLHRRRVVVADIGENFHDGLVFMELLEELEGNPSMARSEVPLSSDQKRNTLDKALEYFASVYRGEIKWMADAIYHKDLVQTIHLLVAMARHYRCPIPLPKNVSVNASYFERQTHKMAQKRLVAELTGNEDYFGRSVRAVSDTDVFDQLFDRAADKVEDVERNLIKFVNQQMGKVQVTLCEIGKQFMDGVNLIYLISLAEGYFVPLCSYHVCPVSDSQRLHNVSLAFELLQHTVPLPARKLCSPKLIMQADLKATLRLLYAVYRVYKKTCVSESSSQQRVHTAV